MGANQEVDMREKDREMEKGDKRVFEFSITILRTKKAFKPLLQHTTEKLRGEMSVRLYVCVCGRRGQKGEEEDGGEQGKLREVG